LFLLFLADLNLNLEHIVLEVALFLRTIWEDHFTIAVLDTSDPLALVTASIGPVHLAVAVALIFFVFALVDVSTGPLEHTVAMLTIV